MVYESLEAEKILQAQGISCSVIDVHTIKPIDSDAIVELSKKSKLFVSVEEQSIIGGLGSVINDLIISKRFKKVINIEGDKSLSIRWALLASQSIGKSTATNLLRSEDVLNTINCLKKLGVKISLFKNGSPPVKPISSIGQFRDLISFRCLI